MCLACREGCVLHPSRDSEGVIVASYGVLILGNQPLHDTTESAKSKLVRPWRGCTYSYACRQPHEAGEARCTSPADTTRLTVLLVDHPFQVEGKALSNGNGILQSHPSPTLVPERHKAIDHDGLEPSTFGVSLRCAPIAPMVFLYLGIF
jgi:hypothetical protein